MRYLLDTSAVLAHYRQESGWDTVQALFEDTDTEIAIASVTVAELARRLHDLGAAHDEIEEALLFYGLLFSEVLPIDSAAAWAAYRIGWQTSARLPLVDALIAAAAQLYDATLVHRDPHMSAIPSDVLGQQTLE